MHKHCHHPHHHHHHSHGPERQNSAFAIGIVLNLVFVFAEAFYGVISNSLALVADAGHNFSDVIGLVIAWVAFWLTKRKPSRHFTYGFRRSSILSSLFNALILLLALGGIIWEAIHRFSTPAPVQTQTMMWVAGLGIVINSLTAMLFFRDRHHDMNIRGAFMHMAADALISLGVVVSGFVIAKTSWLWIDPAVSIVICGIIFFGTWSLLKDSVRLVLDAVPEGIDPSAVRSYFESLSGVSEVHDLHIWAMSTTETALSVHLVMPKGQLSDVILGQICRHLREKFRIHHPTIQLERGDASFVCELKSDEVV